MNWNESVKKILDFIPHFNDEVVRIKNLSGKLSSATKSLNKANSLSVELIERIEALEVKKDPVQVITESYNDKKLKKEISKLSSNIDNIHSQLLLVKKSMPTNYDDSDIKDSILKVSNDLSKIKPYDDKPIMEAINRATDEISSIESYDDSLLRDELQKAVVLCKRSDSTFRELAEYVDQLKVNLNQKIEQSTYNDSEIVEAIESIKLDIEKLSESCDKMDATEFNYRIELLEKLLGVKNGN